MPIGPNGEKRAAHVIANAVDMMRVAKAGAGARWGRAE